MSIYNERLTANDNIIIVNLQWLLRLNWVIILSTVVNCSNSIMLIRVFVALVSKTNESSSYNNIAKIH